MRQLRLVKLLIRVLGVFDLAAFLPICICLLVGGSQEAGAFSLVTQYSRNWQRLFVRRFLVGVPGGHLRITKSKTQKKDPITDQEILNLIEQIQSTACNVLMLGQLCKRVIVDDP